MRLACPYQLSPTQNLLGNGMQASARNEDIATDPYWASVVLLAINDNAADGTTTFIDQSTSAKTLTAVGNSQYDTAQAPTGMTSSGLFDGTGDRVTAADSADWVFGSGDFTVEGFVRFATTTGNPCPISQWNGVAGQKSWLIELDPTTLNFYYSADGSAHTAKACGTSVTTDTWYFFAASRTGNTLECYLNTARGSTTDVTGISLFNSTAEVRIGDNAYVAGTSVNGWVGCCRITKGVGRYTGATITVPTLPFPTS